MQYWIIRDRQKFLQNNKTPLSMTAEVYRHITLRENR